MRVTHVRRILYTYVYLINFDKKPLTYIKISFYHKIAKHTAFVPKPFYMHCWEGQLLFLLFQAIYTLQWFGQKLKRFGMRLAATNRTKKQPIFRTFISYTRNLYILSLYDLMSLIHNHKWWTNLLRRK